MNINPINDLAGSAPRLPPNYIIARKMQLIGILERLCQEIELTDAQLELARRRYEGVGDWLASATDPILRALAIYLQGSTALGTTVRPLGRNEHDVDLIALARQGSANYSPVTIKLAVGHRLRENRHYAPLLQEKPRCWRLTYANEFHLDITPSIPNPACTQGGELVPDKLVQAWKPTNPKGYRSLFDRRALLTPRLRVDCPRPHHSQRQSAEFEAFPESSSFKGILRRIVQVAKRHRDIHFQHVEPGSGADLGDPHHSAVPELRILRVAVRLRHRVRPAVRCAPPDATVHRAARRGPQNSVVRLERDHSRGKLCRKWNNDANLPQAFFAWHRQAVVDLEQLAELDGFDVITRHLGGAFGPSIASKVMAGITANVSSSPDCGAAPRRPINRPHHGNRRGDAGACQHVFWSAVTHGVSTATAADGSTAVSHSAHQPDCAGGRVIARGPPPVAVPCHALSARSAVHRTHRVRARARPEGLHRGTGS